MNPRLVALSRRSSHSGSASYARIIAPSELGSAASNQPPAALRRFKNSRHENGSPHTPATPLDSALVNHCHSQGLKIQQMQHLREKWGLVHILLTTFPKRNDTLLLTFSAPVVTSLPRYFASSSVSHQLPFSRQLQIQRVRLFVADVPHQQRRSVRGPKSP